MIDWRVAYNDKQIKARKEVVELNSINDKFKLEQEEYENKNVKWRGKWILLQIQAFCYSFRKYFKKDRHVKLHKYTVLPI